MEKKFAFISWTNGPDKDAISIVDSHWLLDFNQNELEKEYLVECRTTSKKPTNGWPVETARVIQLSDKENELKRMERTLLGEQSPTIPPKRAIRKTKRLAEPDSDEEPETPTVSIGKKKKDLSAAKQRTEEQIFAAPSIGKMKKDLVKQRTEEQIIPAASVGQKKTYNGTGVTSSASSLASQTECSVDGTSSSTDGQRMNELMTQVKALQKENTKLCTLLTKEIPSLVKDVRAVLNQIQDPKSKQTEVKDSPLQVVKSSEVNLVEDGSVKVSAHCWQMAKEQKTANGMARMLLVSLFSTEVLLKSNLTGGKNKVNPEAERREPLDKAKVDALIGAVLVLHPETKASDVRKTLNARICELRHHLKHKA